MRERWCKECGAKLIVGVNWYPSHQATRKYICNHCFREVNKDTHRRTDALLKRRGSVKAREEAILLLGGKCVKCGFSDIRALCIDHLDGRGSKARRSIGNSRYYKTILKQIKDGSRQYQCLCVNCNMIKAREKSEYGVRKYK